MSAVTTLSELQAGLLELVKQGRLPTGCTDSYLQVVAVSPELVVVREVITWWRRQTVEACAPFTSRLLQREGRLNVAAAQLSARPDLSPFRDLATRQFLSALTEDLDPIVAACADFELSLLKSHTDASGAAFMTRWPCNPYLAFEAIMRGTPLPRMELEEFETEVSATIPDYFKVFRVVADGAM
jgi:hypothetical protein